MPRKDPKAWRSKLHEVIFEADTPAGRAFDVALLISILISVVVVLLESVAELRESHGRLLLGLEWGFTLLFTIEYVLRLLCVGRPGRYAGSFFGVVDLLAIAPTYLSLFVTGTQSLMVIRSLRLLRIFRVMKLAQFVSEARMLTAALKASSRKILIFLGTVVTMILVLGSLMYLIEGEESGFTNIPQSIYWAIVTMTTVGYGDIAPATVLGKLLASLMMILGYGIIAVPTGIVGVEIYRHSEINTQACPQCSAEGHDTDAVFCKYCGSKL